VIGKYPKIGYRINEVIMDKKPNIKTVRLLINVEDGAAPSSRTGEIIQDLVTYTKNLIPFTAKEKSKKAKRK
jgi:hypothetical protein